jgi:hypothetical protein
LAITPAMIESRKAVNDIGTPLPIAMYRGGNA